MGGLGNSGSLVAGIILVILGVVLRWDLIDWLIDLSGLILLIIGIILVVISLIQMFGGKKSGSSDY